MEDEKNRTSRPCIACGATVIPNRIHACEPRDPKETETLRQRIRDLEALVEGMSRELARRAEGRLEMREKEEER